MNKNITELFGRIFSSEELMKKFASINEIDELYKFCLSIKGGYTEEEFNNFIMELLEFFDNSESKLQELDEADSNLVAGGAGGAKKWLAGSLAAASMFSAGVETFAKGTSENVGTSSSVSQSIDTSKKEVSIDTKIKEKIKQIWRDHSGKILTGTALLALAATVTGVVLYKKDDWKKSYEAKKKEREDKVNARKAAVDALEARKTRLMENGKVKPDSEKDYIETLDMLEKSKLSLSSTEKDNQTTGVSKLSVLASALAGGTTLVKGVSSVWNMLGNGITKFSTRAKELKSIAGFGRDLADMVNTFQYNYEIAKAQIEKADFDPEKKKKEFENDLLGIKGQDKALDKIRTFYYGILMERDVAKASKKDGTANVIVLNGPAGVGKTLTANALAKALCNGEYYSMNGPNELDGTGDIKKDLLGDGSSSLWAGIDFDNPKRGVATYLQNNPEGVIVINEYDKIKRKRATDTHPLDELLRGMLDEGFIISGGKRIDCSKVTFIFTTNETDASLQGRVKVENGKLVDPDLEHDITGSRTVVLHDKSFLTRFKTISFENLSEDAYYEIAKKELSPIVRFMASDMGENVTLNISDETYREIAKFTVGIQEGARPIKDIFRNLCSKISILLGSVKAKNPNVSLKGLKLNTSFNFEGRNGDFSVSLD